MPRDYDIIGGAMKGCRIWRMIDTGTGGPSENMALAEVMLQGCLEGKSQPGLHWYTWSAPAVTLGYFQDVEETVNRDACRTMGVRVVRRITGGRAVVHHRDLSFSLVFPSNSDMIPAGIRGSYRTIAQGFVEGLNSLGIKAYLADVWDAGSLERQKRRLQPACFLTRISSEILVSGRKVIGFAQKRVGGWILMQGTILMGVERSLWKELLRYPEYMDAAGIRIKLAAGMAALSEVAGREIRVRDLEDAVFNGLSAIIGIEFERQRLSVDEQAAAASLCADRYRDLVGCDGIPVCTSKGHHYRYG
ncbi:MAG: biotin/lipoate A/B protein ligase family protein [bacterium]